MLSSSVLKIINSIESKFPVDQWVIEGVHIWPIVRQRLADHLNSKQAVIRTKKISRLLSLLHGGFSTLRRLVTTKIADRSKEDKIRKTDILFIFPTTSRARFNNHFYSRFFTPIQEIIELNNLSSLALEWTIGNQDFLTPRMDLSKRFDMGILLIKSYLKSFLYSNKKDLKTLPRYQDFLNQIQNEYGLISRIQPARIFINAIRINRLTAHFERLLKETTPKIVFQTCYYNNIGWALNSACHNQRVISVDLQHGVAGETHRSYAQWNRVPSEGYKLLPRIFWTWTQNDHDTIQDWAEKYNHLHQPFYGGNTSMIFPQTLLATQSNHIDLFKSFMNKNGFSKYALITMQMEDIDQITKDAITQSSSVICWGIRFHPTMAQKNNAIIKKWALKNDIKNIDLHYANALPLPLILNFSDLHITGWSATVYEAFAAGKPSIVTTKHGQDIFQNSIPPSSLYYASTSTNMLEFIQKEHDSEGNDSPSDSIQQFFNKYFVVDTQA